MVEQTKKDFRPSERMHTEGRQRMEVSEEERSWWVGLHLHVVCHCFKISFTVTLIVFLHLYKLLCVTVTYCASVLYMHV